MSVFKHWRTGAFLSARVVTDCLVSIRCLSWVLLLGVAQRSHVVLKTFLGGFHGTTFWCQSVRDAWNGYQSNENGGILAPFRSIAYHFLVRFEGCHGTNGGCHGTKGGVSWHQRRGVMAPTVGYHGTNGGVSCTIEEVSGCFLTPRLPQMTPFFGIWHPFGTSFWVRDTRKTPELGAKLCQGDTKKR